MAPRAFLSLLFSVTLGVAILGLIVSYSSKSIETDKVLNTPYAGYYRIVLDKKLSRPVFFRTYHPGDRRTCVSWMSSEVIDVKYKLGKVSANKPWYWSTGRGAAFWRGHGEYTYEFIKKTQRPVEVIFNLESDPRYCGYLGNTARLAQEPTPIDVFTDWLGMTRLPTRFGETSAVAVRSDNVQKRASQTSRRTQTASTTRTAPVTPPPKPKSQFVPLTDSPVTQLISPGAKTFGKPSSPRADLSHRDLVLLKRELDGLGYREPLFGSVKAWQRKHGYSDVGGVTVEQLAKMRAEIQGRTSGQKTSSRERWARVQRHLNAINCPAGAVDGIPGKKTREAIKCWQRRNGQRPTGQLSDAAFTALSR